MSHRNQKYDAVDCLFSCAIDQKWANGSRMWEIVAYIHVVCHIIVKVAEEVEKCNGDSAPSSSGSSP